MERIFSSILEESITPLSFFICTIISLLLGSLLSLVYMFKNNYTKSFIVTLALLPMIVGLVMMLVNGNIGTGIAVMGAFSLVRFRSAQGSAREILAIFAAMAIGLATGVGYVGIAAVFTVIFSIALLILNASSFGNAPRVKRSLKITIPESLDYTEVFEDIMQEFTSRHELVRVKTTNLGSLYQLSFEITLRDIKREKEFIDALRCKNGNLDIICSRFSVSGDEL